jgi:hypothetical protein
MIRLISILVLFAFGCGAATPVVQYKPIPEKQYVETRDLPEAPDAKPIPKDKDWVKALPAGTTHDENGVLLSPEKAVRAKLWKISYKSLLELYGLDRQIFGQHRIIYDERLKQANKEIHRLSPSWWDENKGTMGWATGFIAGAAATIAIVYAVDEVQK